MKTEYRQHQLLAAFMLLLSGAQFQACTSADDTTNEPWQGTPLELTARIAGEADTRTAINDVTGKTDVVWADKDQIAVRCVNELRQYDETKQYKITDTSIGKMESVDAASPFYWQSAADEYEIQALYSSAFKSKPITNLTQTIKDFSVQDDQTLQDGQTPVNYLSSDLLATPVTPLTYSPLVNNSLEFYHQTAKVVVNITGSDVGNIENTKVKINHVRLQGDYTLPASGSTTSGSTTSTSNHYGTWSSSAAQDKSITMYKKESLYAALVIPQTIAGDTKLFEFTVPGYAPFYYTVPSETTWEAGTMYTYNIKIEGNEVTATVTPGDISWGGEEGGSGAGSVDI